MSNTFTGKTGVEFRTWLEAQYASAPKKIRRAVRNTKACFVDFSILSLFHQGVMRGRMTPYVAEAVAELLGKNARCVRQGDFIHVACEADTIKRLNFGARLIFPGGGGIVFTSLQ